MNVPCTTECGHSFCYDCLNSWFENKLNCPNCRHEIEHKPVLNIQLKDVSKNITDLLIDTIADVEEKEKMLKQRQESLLIYEFDIKHDHLFGDLFKSALTLIDNSDGVPRCGNCHWEAHGSVCLHCGTRFRIPRDDAYYDSEDGDAYNEDDEEVNELNEEYDSDDSFVDSRAINQINRDLVHSEDDDILSSDNELEVNAEWYGFRTNDSQNSADLSGGNINSPIEISGDDEDNQGNYYESGELQQALDDFHDAHINENEPIRGRIPRVIQISDDESD
jgi:hypothetical protein